MFHILNFPPSLKIRRADKLHGSSGVVVLPVVLLVGGLIVVIGVAGVFIAYYLNQSGFGVKLSEEALAAAQSGIQDAMLRIVRDKNFNTYPNSYTISVGSNSAQVFVCRDVCAGTNKSQIDSLGTSFNKQRKIRAIVNINNFTGEVRLESEREIAI